MKNEIIVHMDTEQVEINGQKCSFYEAGLYINDDNQAYNSKYPPVTDDDDIIEILKEKHNDAEITFTGTPRHRKNALAVFGNRYSVEFSFIGSVINRIKNIDWKDVFSNLYIAHPEMQGSTAVAYLDLETLEIGYHGFIGNTSLQQTSHLLKLNEISYPIDEGLTVDDFLNKDEFDSLSDEQKENTWEYIRNLDDYVERLVDAYLFYFNETEHEHTQKLISGAEEIYQEHGLI